MGKIPNITRETVTKEAEALPIDVEEIPASLRWSEAIEVVKDTNTVVHEVQATTEKIAETTDRLVETLSTQALDFKIKEGMLIALARRYAEGSPNDFEAAYAGLEQALDVAAQDRKRGMLPSNTDDAVNAVIARVDALNDDGDIDTAAAVLAEEEARAQAGLLRLYDKGISQAILTRDVEAAVSYELKKLPLEIEAPSPDDSYAYLRGIYIDWYTRGSQKGLNFDASVAIALMRQMVLRFGEHRDKKGACVHNLGAALCTLGRRESGTARLEEAVAAYRKALEEYTRDRVPLDWAMTQMNLGNALKALGRRESGTARLEEAVAAYRNALEERTRDRVPLDWACTLGNEAVALVTLADRTRDAALARRALDQLIEAEAVLREGGHETWAKTFAEQIPEAKALLARLSASDRKD